MMLIRRVHLYSGLFMFPWVLLYGLTGMFFNHPRWFTGGEVRTFQAEAVAGGALAQMPTAQSMAEAVVAAINETTGEGGKPRVVLTSDRTPEYSGFLTFNVQADKSSHIVTVDPVTGHGQVRTTIVGEQETPLEPKPTPLADVRRVELETNTMAAAQSAVPQVLSELGLPSGEAPPPRRAPSLLFSAMVDDEPVALTYNMGNGAISAQHEDAESPYTVRSLMTRLHLSRGYSPHWNVKWLWAVLVDGMFLSMVFWGLSGVLMWWQIKRTRWLGGGFLLASLALTVVLVAGMHDSLSASGRRGRGAGGGGGAAARGGAAAQRAGGGGQRQGAGGGHQHGGAEGEQRQVGGADATPAEGDGGRRGVRAQGQGGRGRGGFGGGQGGRRGGGENGAASEEGGRRGRGGMGGGFGGRGRGRRGQGEMADDAGGDAQGRGGR
ncbi:hypothetical protein [Kolteria novifilia]